MQTNRQSSKAAEPVLSEAGGRTLAQKDNCFACHSIEKKVAGPAWKDVAARYHGDVSAEDKQIAKVSNGSSGVWGSVPMPANSPAVKDAGNEVILPATRLVRMPGCKFANKVALIRISGRF